MQVISDHKKIYIFYQAIANNDINQNRHNNVLQYNKIKQIYKEYLTDRVAFLMFEAFYVV